MDANDQLITVIDRIYEASLDRSKLVGALAEFDRFIGAIATDLYISSGSNPEPIAVNGIPEELMREYLLNYHDTNKRVTGVLAAPEGALITDFDIATREEMATNPYYQEIIFKNGYGYFVGAPALYREDEGAFLGIHYPLGFDCYTESTLRRIRLLLPHIARAAQILNRLDTAAAQESRLRSAIDTLSTGIVLLNARAEVVHVNVPAEILLASHSGISISRRRVLIDNPALDRKLQQIVANALDNKQAQGSGGALLCPEPETGNRLSITVAPLPSRLRKRESLGAMLLITDPLRGVADNTESLLQSVYDLTPAEARISVALARGETLTTYTARNGISIETSRSLLKRAMQKTGVNRQTDLVRLILNSFSLVPG